MNQRIRHGRHAVARALLGAAMCAVLALAAQAVHAQSPAGPMPHEGAGLSGTFPGIGAPATFLESAAASAANAPSLPVMAAQGDPVVINPGARDFLEPNRPNPFGSVSRSTQISYAIAGETRVELHIYDFFYRRIITLVDAVQLPGRYTVAFDPPPTLPSGMYFYEMKTSRSRELRRMMYIK